MIVVSNALISTRTMDDAMDDARVKNTDLNVADDSTQTDDKEMMDTDSVMSDDVGDWDDGNDDDDNYSFGQEEITRLDQSSLDMLRDGECCIRRVDLEHSKPGDDGIVALCDALRQNTSVEELVLDDVGMGMRGVLALADLIRSSRTIAEVRLSRDEIGDGGLFLLADAIACNGSVVSLDLCRNGFTEKGARALAVALRRNGTIAYVAITGNDVGDAGAEAIALYGLLERPTPLKGLSLMRCNVGDRGAVAIAASLQRKKSSLLASLCLASNSVGDRGAAAMAGMLRYDRRLVDLSLENNRFGCRGIKELAWALLLNTTLRHARIRPAEQHDESGGSEGWHFLEAVASHISKDSCDDLVAELFVASLFVGTWKPAFEPNGISIAQRNLEGGCFDRPLTIEGTAALGKSSPRRGQRRLLRVLFRAGLKHLGRCPALIPE